MHAQSMPAITPTKCPYLYHLVLLPGRKVGVLDVNLAPVVLLACCQAMVGRSQVMGQLPHGPSIADDVMDGESKNIVVAT